MSIEIGSVVQLKSGGAPMTVTGCSYCIPTMYKLALVSVGGSVQELSAPAASLKNYIGPPTPPIKHRVHND